MLENKEGNSDIVIFYYILQNLEQLWKKKNDANILRICIEMQFYFLQ